MSVMYWTPLAIALLAAPAQEQDLLRDVIAAVEKQENHLRWLEVHAEATIDHYSNEGKPVNRGGASVTLFHSGKPGGRALARFDPEISLTEAGQLVEEHYVVGFLGSLAFKNTLSIGLLGKTVPINELRLVAERPALLSFACAMAGWAATCSGLFEEHGKYLSDILRASPKKGATSAAESDGRQVVIWIGDDKRNDGMAIYLLPDRGYAIASVQHRRSGLVSHATTVSDYIDVDGLSYPQTIEDVTYLAPGVPQQFRRITCNSVRLLSASDWERATRTSIPSQTTVSDEVRKERYRVGFRAAELEQRLQLRINEVRGMLSRNEEDVRVRDGDASNGGPSYFAIPIAAGFAVAVIVALMIRRGRRRRDAGRFIAAALVTLSASLSAQEGGRSGREPSYIGLREFPEERVDNCAVGCAAMVLRYFGRECGVEDVASELGVGKQWERVVTLQDLARCLRANGVSAEGVTGLGFESIRQAASGSEVAILHVQDKIGHFVLAMGSRPNAVLVVDPPYLARWIGNSGVVQKEFWGKINTIGILARKAPDDPPKTVAVSSCRTRPVRVAIRSADSVSDHVDSTLHLHNDTGDDLTVERSESSCSCLKEAFLAGSGNQIAAGADGDVVLRFDSRKLVVGREQPILLRMKAPLTGRELDVRLIVSVDVEGGRGALNDRPSVFPAVLQLDSSDSGTGVGRLKLMLPEGYFCERVVYGGTVVSVKLCGAVPRQGLSAAIVELEYEVTMNTERQGALNERIEFAIGGALSTKLFCDIRGSGGRAKR